MNLGFLASFIVLALLVSFNAKRYSKRSKLDEKEFWARETRANSVRRKSLDGLRYIKIPLETFPTHLLNDDAAVMECIETIESLTSMKIVNLTGWSNTDLKLEYGTANINDLSQYDQNYTLLVRTLQKWAEALAAADHPREAAILLEFAVGTGTDVSQTYYQLAAYWAEEGDSARIEQLIQAAEGLRSSNRNSILRHLRSEYGKI